MKKMKYNIVNKFIIKNNTSITFVPKNSNIKLNSFIMDIYGNQYEIIGVEMIRKILEGSESNISILVKGIFKGNEFKFI